MEKALSYIRSKFSLILSCFVYAAVCVFLWFAEYRLYGEALDTGLFYYAAFPPVFLLFSFIRDEDETKKPVPQKRPRLVNALNLLLVLACALTIAYLLWKDPYMLRAYHFFGLLTVAAVTALIKKARPGCPVLKRKPHLFSVSYGCVLLSTLLYIAFLQPCTVARAQETLQSQGYAGVVFAGDYGAQAIALAQTPYAGEECAQADGLGYYLFDAQKNGARWGVFVRVTSGEIAALDRADENKVLQMVLDRAGT